MSNMELWNKVRTPPDSALKKITGGRLKNKTDISPQWRYQVLTENFGVCGTGWKYTVDRMWQEAAPEGQVFAFAQVSVSYKTGDTWSDPIPGTGGAMLVAMESGGLHANDEAYKMAITDALSVATKMLGVAADVYLGQCDGGKYQRPHSPEPGTDSGHPKRPTCPSCKNDAAVIKGKEEYGGGWVCFKKKNGCGHTWQEEEQGPAGEDEKTKATREYKQKLLGAIMAKAKSLRAGELDKYVLETYGKKMDVLHIDTLRNIYNAVDNGSVAAYFDEPKD